MNSIFLCRDLQPGQLVTQVSRSDINAVKETFAECKRFYPELQIPELDGCNFHQANAVILKAFKLGLKTAFCEDPRVQERIRCYLALAFCPPDIVPDLVIRLINEDPIPSMDAFNRYFDVSIIYN